MQSVVPPEAASGAGVGAGAGGAGTPVSDVPAGGGPRAGDGAEVRLACSGCRHVQPVAATYFCSACHAVRCSHPVCTSESVEAMYCPMCNCRFGTFESMEHKHRCSKCFVCPVCQSPTSVALNPAGDAVFMCGYCAWESDAAGLTAPTVDALIKTARAREDDTPLAAFAAGLRPAFTSVIADVVAVSTGTSTPSAPPPAPRVDATAGGPKSTPHVDSDSTAAAAANNPAVQAAAEAATAAAACPAPASLLACGDLSATPSAHRRMQASLATAPWQATVPPADADLPARHPLVGMRYRRCRTCVDAGLPGILVRPNPMAFTHSNPSAGLHRWFVKHATATALLPSVRAMVARVASPTRTILLVEVCNPVDDTATLTLANHVPAAADGEPPAAAPAVTGSSWPLTVELPAFDETLSLSADVRRLLERAAAGTGAETDDVDDAAVVATRDHKVLLRLPVDGDLSQQPLVLDATAKYPAAVFQALSGLPAAPDAAVAADHTLHTQLHVQVVPRAGATTTTGLLYTPVIE